MEVLIVKHDRVIVFIGDWLIAALTIKGWLGQIRVWAVTLCQSAKITGHRTAPADRRECVMLAYTG